VREERDGQVDAQSAEKEEAANLFINNWKMTGDLRSNAQKRDPSQVLHKRREQTPMAQPILQYREAEVARGGEHGRARDPDLEAVQVIPVNLEREAEDEVVDQRQ